MIVAGTLCNKMAPALRKVYDQMAEPRWVLSMGPAPTAAATTTTATPWCAAATASCRSTSTCPGCPPTAEALLYGIIQLQQKIRAPNTIARA